MKILAALAALGLLVTVPAVEAADVAAGEKAFAKCKSCHMIEGGGETIVRGGKVGPNLYGIVGKQAGSIEGFRYGDSLVEAGEKGLVWDEASLADYITDPREFLSEYLGGSARSKMSYKLRSGAEDVAAYLAQFGGES
ncbi:MAG: c-type cytochrome [Paracoccaceae bacterium]